jgi:hypothetical protein
MSSTTWTAAALSSSRRRLSGRCWRIVEAQHEVATMKLVDTLAEQEVLEAAIERSKPVVPAPCRHLHYLLSTPFRYGAPYPRGSRFRRAGVTPGVFYGSRTPDTAMAETAYHRLQFFAESPGTPWPANAGAFTAFAVTLRTRAALDLTMAPLVEERAAWVHPSEYEACQALAEQARLAEVEVLRYESARDPSRGMNLAVLSCRAFSTAEPVAWQTWRLALSAAGARAVCSFPEQRLEFSRQALGL